MGAQRWHSRADGKVVVGTEHVEEVVLDLSGLGTPGVGKGMEDLDVLFS